MNGLKKNYPNLGPVFSASHDLSYSKEQVAVETQALVDYLDNLLTIKNFNDYCPNGLQVAGKNNIDCLVTGVTANQALIDAAIEKKADAILVHHGYFWKGEDRRLLGIQKNRIKTLLTQDINLFAYHLPLDAHPQWGNNIQLAHQLEIQVTGTLEQQGAPNYVFHGNLKRALPPSELAQWLTSQLNREPLHIQGRSKTISSIAWCTGAAQSFIQYAIAAKCDAYLTGEASEQTVHQARESGIHFFAAGHHATERYGVAALGNHLTQKFGIKHFFVDIDNPV